MPWPQSMLEVLTYDQGGVIIQFWRHRLFCVSNSHDHCVMISWSRHNIFNIIHRRLLKGFVCVDVYLMITLMNRFCGVVDWRKTYQMYDTPLVGFFFEWSRASLKCIFICGWVESDKICIHSGKEGPSDQMISRKISQSTSRFFSITLCHKNVDYIQQHEVISLNLTKSKERCLRKSSIKTIKCVSTHSKISSNVKTVDSKCN